MKPDVLAKDVYRVSAKVGSRDLFEGIWPIPDGVMLNSYVLKGSEKTVLVDLVKDWDGACDAIEAQMKELSLTVADIDVLVINHMEPDHTGSLASFVRKNPKVEIFCSDKSVPLIKAFYGVTENVHAVKDGETLDIGGKTLKFFLTPNIHWPETMMTLDEEDGILFSCDAFGAYGQYDHCFHDQLGEDEQAQLNHEMERYYANIISSFSPFVIRGITKVVQAAPGIRVVGPSHGVVWRDDHCQVIDTYLRLAKYAAGPREKEITLVWASMYGNTQALVDTIVKAVESEGVKLNIFQVPQTHASFVLEKAWRSEGLIFGMPTYEYKMFPPMYAILDVLDRSHVTGRKIMRFGSFGWSGGAQKQFDEFVTSMKLECCGTVEYQGYPTEADKKKAYDMAKQLAHMIAIG
ncbi:MAG: FprA family A-type flavoprotein [Sphaerochaeta sp.]|nr:FprA family A-type flavoprotein [Sphaerochaeta sp.]MCH3919611.1 FprA family A-type flavoprotein [Sphaerochaeta sp.]MCI2044856.1 FprA family A-type flavoprotein [Sphaerochaeta sp.]MCI2075907.1 FprA family A-type flavoprotein [Sphaerochaeta sp.]MCI2097509.1 FprA family A-type flavoprotein [Sphaerochaeta sp.]